MKKLFIAAAATALSGSALAFQSDAPVASSAGEGLGPTITSAPDAVFAPPPDWSAEQRRLWDQHLASFPDSWTEAQRSAFTAMMAVPPSNWTQAQRTLYTQHQANLPAAWSSAQRAAYRRQIAPWSRPWIRNGTVTAPSAGPGGSARPDMSNFAGVGGPYEAGGGESAAASARPAATASYPPCDPGPGDDHCIQLYERGIRAQPGA